MLVHPHSHLVIILVVILSYFYFLSSFHDYAVVDCFPLFGLSVITLKMNQQQLIQTKNVCELLQEIRFYRVVK